MQISGRALAAEGGQLLTDLLAQRPARLERRARWLEGRPSLTLRSNPASFRGSIDLNASGVYAGGGRYIPWADLDRIDLRQVRSFSLQTVCIFTLIPTKSSRRRGISAGVASEQAESLLAELDFWRARGAEWAADNAPGAAAWPRPPQARQSSLALISLIFGLLAWSFLPLIGAVVAVVTGHLARREIRSSPERMVGQGWSTLGLTLGYVQMALFALFFFASLGS